MLRLLDGNLNVNGSPNENYARELLELYTIGRGLDGFVPTINEPGDYYVYREQDVQAAAKALSGWDFDRTFSNIDPETGLPRGKVRGTPQLASGHDNDVKQFSDRLDNQTITPDASLLNGGRATEASALQEISDLIEIIYSKHETARNICRRIYRFYVYYEIDPTLDDTVIEAMAQTFIANGYKLQPVLEDLFKSQHFYEAAAGVRDDQFGAIIKSPLDLMAGTFRFFGLSLPDYTSDPVNFYKAAATLLDRLEKMGLNFYEPFDVAGYDAYHQYPIYHRSWISTNFLTRSYEFIKELLNPTASDLPVIDPVSFVRNNFPAPTASNARSLIIALAQFLLPVSDNLTFDAATDDTAGITAERMNYFLTAFLQSPQIDPDPEGAWTIRWTNQVGLEVIENQLRNLFNALMQSPEYQLY